MRAVKNEKRKKALMHAAAEFLSHTSSRASLITVTGVLLSAKGERAQILITVHPDAAENAALQFARRQAGKFREYLGERVAVRRLPLISFALDRGEKRRRRIDELSEKI